MRRTTFFLSIVLLPHISCSSDDNNTVKLRRGRRKEYEERNCMPQYRQKKKKNKLISWWWSTRRQKHISRKAYRMAILSSLAYHDFQDEINWEFALVDDPSPPEYLMKSADNSTQQQQQQQHILWGKKRRHPIQRILADVGSRLQVSICRLATPNSIRILPSKHHLCKQKYLKKHETGKKYNIEWFFSNWHEQNKAKLKWHDTDLIIATSGTSELVLAFSGTASVADAFTNAQTLERASHSGLFDIGTSSTNNVSSIEGNIHRGFLNAYSRVERGTIRRLSNGKHDYNLMESLNVYFNECIIQQRGKLSNSTAVAFLPSTRNKTKKEQKKHKKHVKRYNKQIKICHSHDDNKLRDMLLNVTTSALRSGYTVSVVGHSLAGALATIHALDIITNHEDIPINKLHLYTFGAPEIADSLFYESIGAQSPRLRYFLSDNARVHRYVTQSEKTCATDMVSSITSNSLNRVKRIGGVRGHSCTQ